MILLSIVMPAFNEGENLKSVIDEVADTMAAHSWATPYELIIINDGSSDDTASLADTLARTSSSVRVFNHAHNQGLGAALRTGYTASRGQFVTWMSSDGEIDIHYLLDLLRLADEADIVISGKRLREGIAHWYREVFSGTLGLLSRLLVGFNWSQMSGIYLIRGDLLRQFNFHSTTGMVNFEVYLLARRRGLRIVEGPPLNARARLSGKSKVANIRTILKTFHELLKLRFVISDKK